MAEVRFYRENVYELAEQMQLTDEITCDNGLVVSSVPALCRYLERHSYLADMEIGFFILQCRFLSFLHNKPHGGNDLRWVALSAFKIQEQLALPSKISPKIPEESGKIITSCCH